MATDRLPVAARDTQRPPQEGQHGQILLAPRALLLRDEGLQAEDAEGFATERQLDAQRQGLVVAAPFVSAGLGGALPDGIPELHQAGHE